MKANWKTLLTVSTLIVVVALFITFFLGKAQDKNDSKISTSRTEGSVAGSTTIKSGDYVERLAKYMSDKGMVLYGSYQSFDSKNQKELFGEAAKYLDYVECDASGLSSNPDECIAQKINSYPTWLFEGKQYVGKKSLAELAAIVGFTE
ncbi:MAG: hypothetical protein M1324_01330 [Patescibacteria group bacterium]|nr:hypothetical protein [Patescibacteria group bacterium]